MLYQITRFKPLSDVLGWISAAVTQIRFTSKFAEPSQIMFTTRERLSGHGGFISSQLKQTTVVPEIGFDGGTAARDGFGVRQARDPKPLRITVVIRLG